MGVAYGVGSGQQTRTTVKLFIASFLALYFELVVIRYLSTEIRVFAYLKNLPLIASFFGIGLGMIVGRPRKFRLVFPGAVLALFLLIVFSSPLGLTHIPFPSGDYFVWTSFERQGIPPIVLVLRYWTCTTAILAVLVGFFVVLGGIVGEQLQRVPALRGYGINLAGSMAGIIIFTYISYWDVSPAVWILIGFLVAIPFFLRDPLVILSFVIVVLAAAAPQANTYWSPYYRVTLQAVEPPHGWSRPAAYFLTVNHDFHQKIVDLSDSFISRYPEAEPNRSARLTYGLPYQLFPNPGRVLVVGAGTGNDVAAALRHGVDHVDAVEIDPVILDLGRKYHPERPYDSAKVTLFVDDARAFFKKAQAKYDLVIFGFLDAETMLSAFSSIRLDNYVYTLESFREARRLLNENACLILYFATRPAHYITQRLFDTLTAAFGQPPRAYFIGYDSAGGGGAVFVEGGARDGGFVGGFSDITDQLQRSSHSVTLATDHWPFLYLPRRTIPVSILLILVTFLIGARRVLRRTMVITSIGRRENLHLFALGAGFLLLETKAVTELSLLFGSTWVVNAVVIAAFLMMALLANAVVTVRPPSRRLSYAVLFLMLVFGTVFPYSILEALPSEGKVSAAAAIVALPVFFSGLIFSSSLSGAPNPAQALGINLLGAVVGGTLENLVMVAGTPVLGVIAIALYTLSAFCLRKAPMKDPGLAVPGAPTFH